MSRRGLVVPPSAALAAVLLAAASSSGCDDDETVAALPTVEEVMHNLPASCAFQCQGCAEPATPYDCPALRPFAEIPHAPACGGFSGAFPTPQAGRCTVSEPTGPATRKAGPMEGGVVLPNGRAIRPAGREFAFSEGDLVGGFPQHLLLLPATRFALVSDGGIHDHALRLVDLERLAAGTPPVASVVEFERPLSLFYGLAWLPPNRALASGGGDGKVYAFDVDLLTGALARAPARDLDLGLAGKEVYYAGPLATTADGLRLLVGPSAHASEVLVFSLGLADHGAKLGVIDLDTESLFDLQRDPFDPLGQTFYATDWSRSRLLRLDLTTLAVTGTVTVAKNPQAIAFLDAQYLVVANADGDSLSVVDRLAGVEAARVPVLEPDAERGSAPTTLAHDAARGRLYVTLAAHNAVEVLAVAPGAPPLLSPLGRIPTLWWPTGVAVRESGDVVILSGKGRGTGTDDEHHGFGEGPITELMRGGIQLVPAPGDAELPAMTAVADEGRGVDTVPGYGEVSCPDGASYDFPVPRDPSEGPSSAIRHVLFVVRENKTYDAVFGDRPDLGDGDPDLKLATEPGVQEQIFQNLRAIAGAFTNFDNYYTDAEQSVQGHVWTAYGRTTDFVERTWLAAWGRGTRPPIMGVTPQGSPEEGPVFAWFQKHGVSFDNMGEIVGSAAGGLDPRYPGLFTTIGRPDIDKSCYVAARARITCDLKSFTYIVQPNDHTFGAKAGAPAPEVMIAVNDEATGMLLEALSHSPFWESSLLIVTEDDPQDGGDHVDVHRTPLVFASPWVRRGYVSKGHYDVASLYKLVAHLFGIPYHNEQIRRAALPLDAFTSTPDFTPYRYLPRTIDRPCNPAGTSEAKQAEAWNFDLVDEQPGMADQVFRMLHRDGPGRRRGGRPPPGRPTP